MGSGGIGSRSGSEAVPVRIRGGRHDDLPTRPPLDLLSPRDSPTDKAAEVGSLRPTGPRLRSASASPSRRPLPVVVEAFRPRQGPIATRGPSRPRADVIPNWLPPGRLSLSAGRATAVPRPGHVHGVRGHVEGSTTDRVGPQTIHAGGSDGYRVSPSRTVGSGLLPRAAVPRRGRSNPAKERARSLFVSRRAEKIFLT